MQTISEKEQPKKSVTVFGKSMAYVEFGTGDPIIFQHGNPTSSYLWRNIMPYLKEQGRCIAIDLIGMGDSDKLDNSGPDSYRFVEHRKYWQEALDALGVTSNVTLVLHDWGSALGFDWARRNPNAVTGIAYMEAIVRPIPRWDQWANKARPIFQAFRSDKGEEMVMDNNIFVEKVLPGSILRGLTEKEMEVYRRPFLNAGEDRRPTLTWPRQIPIEGEPADVVKIVQDYADWLADSKIPKLFVNAEPGAILTGDHREFCRTFANQSEITVKGSHFIQEDSPHEIGAAIADWRSRL